MTGVLKLLEETELRILYLDIDIHHGDAVQDAFYYTDKVLFLDFHRFDPGFFPGTGAVSETGAGTGKYYSKSLTARTTLDLTRVIQLSTCHCTKECRTSSTCTCSKRSPKRRSNGSIRSSFSSIGKCKLSLNGLFTELDTVVPIVSLEIPWEGSM